MDHEVNDFPKGIILKVNVKMQVKFELAHHEATAQRFSCYANRTLPNKSRGII